MGYKSDRSESPVRGHGSPRRRSPSRRERSPARHKSSHKATSPVREKPSSRTRSPKHIRSKSPVPHSPVKGKTSSRMRSPKHVRARSPLSRSPVRSKPSSRTRSPTSAKSRSPESCSPSPRTKRLRRAQAEREVEKVSEREYNKNHGKGGDKAAEGERGIGSPVRNKPLIRTRSPKRAKSRSPELRSPSPQTKQLRKGQVEREAEKVRERKYEKNHGKGGDKAADRERGVDREVISDKRERGSRRDEVDNGSSRSRHGRSTSSDRYHRSRHRAHSPSTAVDNMALDEVTKSRRAEPGDGDNDAVEQMKAAEAALEAKEKQKPSFELSGKLAAETNRVRGITLLFTEPPDARKPDVRWRLYVFKAGEVLNEPLYVHRQSCYLFGRERRVADIPTDHPSCSKQQAVLQYRQAEIEKPDGTLSKQVRPYLMDLGSTNGTLINDIRIEPQRYYELFEKDTIKFGNSSREYVLLHENSIG